MLWGFGYVLLATVPGLYLCRNKQKLRWHAAALAIWQLLAIIIQQPGLVDRPGRAAAAFVFGGLSFMLWLRWREPLSLLFLGQCLTSLIWIFTYTGDPYWFSGGLNGIWLLGWAGVYHQRRIQ